MNVDVQSLDKYLNESKQWMLKFVAGEKLLSEVENPDAFKKSFKKEKTQVNCWKNRSMVDS